MNLLSAERYTRSMRSSRRGIPRLAAICLGVAALVQIPLAWAWVLAFRAWSYEEDSVLVRAPEGSTSGIDAIKVDNCSYPGARWLLVSGWSSAAVPSLSLCRSNTSEPFDSNPTWPWSPRDVLPALADPGQWPQSVPAAPRPGVFFGVTFCQVEAIGWPFLCAEGRSDMGVLPNTWTISGMLHAQSPLHADFPRFKYVALCYRPMWAGYALNTLVDGAALLAVVMGIGALRRARRKRRALCEHCTYDLRGLPAGAPCPECGHPTPSR